jgi:hypothetical protein
MTYLRMQKKQPFSLANGRCHWRGDTEIIGGSEGKEEAEWEGKKE